MAQAWYQGGVSVFDWTDPKHPTEIAYFDRGPVDTTRLSGGGYWSTYWYNGYIVGSEIRRGLDILELKPSAWVSQNEIDAAKSVHFDEFNTQGQPQLVWPTTFTLARAYVDQLERGEGLTQARLGPPAMRSRTPKKRAAELSRCVDAARDQVNGEAQASSQPAKVQTLAKTVRDLAGMEVRTGRSTLDVRCSGQTEGQPDAPWLALEICSNVERPTSNVLH